jgi:hypothetical protein
MWHELGWLRLLFRVGSLSWLVLWLLASWLLLWSLVYLIDSFDLLYVASLIGSFFIIGRVGLSPRYCGHVWPIVQAPDDRWWWLWSNWWNKDWQGITKYSEKTCPSATLSTTNPTWPDPGSNPGRRGRKPATNPLSLVAIPISGAPRLVTTPLPPPTALLLHPSQLLLSCAAYIRTIRGVRTDSVEKTIMQCGSVVCAWK